MAARPAPDAQLWREFLAADARWPATRRAFRSRARERANEALDQATREHEAELASVRGMRSNYRRQAKADAVVRWAQTSAELRAKRAALVAKARVISSRGTRERYLRFLAGRAQA